MMPIQKSVQVCLGLLLLLGATEASAQTSSTVAAVGLFDEGRAAVERGNFDTACAKFRESNRLDPAIGTAFNLANCEEKRGRLATAWVLFKQVAGRMKPEDPRLPVAQERVASLGERVPRVVLQAGSHVDASVRVRLDDVELDSASFGSALPLDPGLHELMIRERGKAARPIRFTLAIGETRSLPLESTASSENARAPSPSPSAPRTERDDGRVLGLSRSNATCVAAVIGGAGLLVGAVAGIVGLGAQGTGNAECSSSTQSCSQKGYDANQRAKTMAVVSSVGFVVGILGGGAATYLYVTAPAPGDAPRTASLGIGGAW